MAKMEKWSATGVQTGNKNFQVQFYAKVCVYFTSKKRRSASVSGSRTYRVNSEDMFLLGGGVDLRHGHDTRAASPLVAHRLSAMKLQVVAQVVVQGRLRADLCSRWNKNKMY